MWSSDRQPAAGALTRRGLLVVLAGGLLAACQVRPVYLPSAPAAGGASMQSALASIAVEAQTDRVGQALMNELVFQLRGGAALESARYRLHLIITKQVSDLAIRAREDIPVAKLVSLTVTYTLTEIATGQVIVSDNVYTTNSFDVTSQRYANLRAEQDAEDRAARAAAADIRLRLSSALLPKG